MNEQSERLIQAGLIIMEFTAADGRVITIEPLFFGQARLLVGNGQWADDSW